MILKRRNLLDIALISLFIFFLACVVLRLRSSLRETTYSAEEIAGEVNGEECDSFYQAKYPSRTYPGIVSEVLRKKFYHGYSHYDIGSNPLGFLFAPIVKNGANAIVIPDDIAKHPNAACSQQSIVGMEIFERKGYQVRKISMFDTVNNVGHFAYEVYYDNSWHFFDTNQEPDTEVLKRYNRPSVAFLAHHPEIVAAAYHKQKQPDMFQRLIMSHKVGPINVFPAPHAYVYQVATKFLSNFGWLIIGLCILARSWYWSRKSKLALQVATKKTAVQNALQPELSRPLEAARAV
jgi:hypothetical protein